MPLPVRLPSPVVLQGPAFRLSVYISDVLFIESRHLRSPQALFSTETRSFYGFEVNFRLEFSLFSRSRVRDFWRGSSFACWVENCSWRMHGVVAAPDAAPASRAPVEAGK